MKKILSVLLTLIFVFLCACSAQGTQDRQLSAHIDGLIEETTIEWKDDNTAVVSFDKHAVNNVAVKLKKAVSSPLKIYPRPHPDFWSWLGRPGCGSGDGAQSGRGCLLDIEVPHRPQDHPQAAERKPQSGAEHHPAGAGAGHLVLRHALDGEFALHQFQLQPRPLRRRCGCGRDDRHRRSAR